MSHRLPEPDRPWMMRTYAGHSTAKKSNALYRSNLAKGQTVAHPRNPTEEPVDTASG
jgi:methylmalonyl-CoA mutase N-terminal domain/subunit